jgi:serine/threonine-protein kinase
MLEWKDAAPRARVLDFGIAIVDGVDMRNADTGSGNPMGTLLYMAPEQLEAKRIGPEADVYATGLILAELVSESSPSRGRTESSSCRR